MLPRDETFARIANVSTQLNLETQVWRTDRDDKTPVLKPVGEETGDDTVLATTDGQTLSIDYVASPASSPTLDPSRCRALTLAGVQCKRRPSTGTAFCWQHGGDGIE